MSNARPPCECPGTPRLRTVHTREGAMLQCASCGGFHNLPLVDALAQPTAAPHTATTVAVDGTVPVAAHLEADADGDLRIVIPLAALRGLIIGQAADRG